MFSRTCVALDIELAEIITVSVRDEIGESEAYSPRLRVGVPMTRSRVEKCTLTKLVMLQAHMKFPPDYPYSPPSIRFMTKVWHPNVYEVSKYILELSIPRTLSLPVSTLSSHTCACPPRIPCPCPFSLHPSLFLSHPALAAPRCITTVPLCPLVRPPLFIFHPSPP